MRDGEAIFEAPVAHESSAYSGYSAYSPEAVGEGAFEDELHEASHYAEASPEDEWEGGHGYSAYSAYSPYASGEDENPYSPEFSHERDPFIGDLIGAAKGLLGFESEDEVGYAQEYEDEWEDEADRFLGKALGGFKKLASMAAPLAKQLAPVAMKALGGMVPGLGAIAPLLGQFLQEGEAEAAQLESHFLSPESIGEIGHEAAHEAALTELIAHEAAEAATEAEAEAVLAATLPITITIMGAGRQLRPVVPAMTQATSRLTKVLRRQGPVGRQLLRTVPAIQRRAVGTLKAAANSGQPVTAPVAVRAMAAATRRVLGSPTQVRRAIVRNGVVRQRVAPPTPRRTAVYRPVRRTPYSPRRVGAYDPRRAAI